MVDACVAMGVSVGESGVACWRMVGRMYMGLLPAEYSWGLGFWVGVMGWVGEVFH